MSYLETTQECILRNNQSIFSNTTSSPNLYKNLKKIVDTLFFHSFNEIIISDGIILCVKSSFLRPLETFSNITNGCSW